MADPAPRAYKPTEAARVLQVSRTTVYELMAAGDLASFHIGTSRRIPADEIERYIAARLEAERKTAAA